MQIFGFSITRARTKASGFDLITHLPRALSGIYGRVREPFAGAWQRNMELPLQDVLTHSTVWACVTLIAADIAKLGINLVAQDAHGIWTPTESAAFSPVLRKPNHYQTRIKFIEQWILSKLLHGNTYVLKARDGRGLVTSLYLLDPSRVHALVAPDGAVFYALSTDQLSGLTEASVTVPAREIIHDVFVAPYHPLVGLSPMTACGMAAGQGLRIQQHSSLFFENFAQVGGILSTVQPISDDDRKHLEEHWAANYAGPANAGKVVALGGGLTYQAMPGVNAVDAQLIEQLKLSAEMICSAFHVPPYKVGVGPAPTLTNVEALNQEYYAQALQNLIECLELLLDEGLELPKPYGTELDVEGGLLRMDTATRVKAATDAIKGGMSPNEVRWRYYDLGPVKGGETPYLQEQNWPLELLAARELPTRAPTAPAPLPPADAPAEDTDAEAETKAIAAFRREAVAKGFHVPQLEAA